MSGEIHEKCAVVGGSTSNNEVDVAQAAFLGLHALQNRGDAASGIASMSPDGCFNCFSGPGLVRDVYTQETLRKLAGTAAIGQNRYPTSKTDEMHNQPIDDKALGFALGHNGNLSDVAMLEKMLSSSHIDTTRSNDSELMAYGIAQEIRSGKDLPDAIEAIDPLLEGAYSCVAIQGDLVVAFRDPFGLRPYSLGAIQDGHMVASETSGLYPMRAQHLGDVAPGEMIIMCKGDIERRQISPGKLKLDIFEIVYFSRIDSEFFGESVGEMRYRLGQELAEQYPFEGDNYLVIGVPDSAIPIAEGYANATGLEYRSVLVKDRYRGGRSFQQKDQAARKQFLDYKFSYVAGPAKGRDLIVVEDSVVRNNTSKKIVELLKRAGARSVSLLSGSPPIGFPDFSGLDTPDQSKLVASYMSPEEIRADAGLDYLGYLSLSRMIRATRQPATSFNLASFTGDYPYKIGQHQRNIKEPVSLEYLETG